MEGLTPVILCVVLMILMLNIGLPIAYAVGFSAMIVGFLTYGSVALEKLGWTTFYTLFNPAWTPLPLFCFIGFLIAQTKIGEDLFRAAKAWLSRVPGALVVSSVLAEAGVAATLGSSAATILTVGPVAMPELERLSYDRKMSLGALTCGGVLGPLIPPSATAIIISGLGRGCCSVRPPPDCWSGARTPLGRFAIDGPHRQMRTKSFAWPRSRRSHLVREVLLTEEGLAGPGDLLWYLWQYFLRNSDGYGSRRRRSLYRTDYRHLRLRPQGERYLSSNDRYSKGECGDSLYYRRGFVLFLYHR